MVNLLKNWISYILNLKQSKKIAQYFLQWSGFMGSAYSCLAFIVFSKWGGKKGIFDRFYIFTPLLRDRGKNDLNCCPFTFGSHVLSQQGSKSYSRSMMQDVKKL